MLGAAVLAGIAGARFGWSLEELILRGAQRGISETTSRFLISVSSAGIIAYTIIEISSFSGSGGFLAACISVSVWASIEILGRSDVKPERESLLSVLPLVLRDIGIRCAIAVLVGMSGGVGRYLLGKRYLIAYPTHYIILIGSIILGALYAFLIVRVLFDWKDLTLRRRVIWVLDGGVLGYFVGALMAGLLPIDGLALSSGRADALDTYILYGVINGIAIGLYIGGAFGAVQLLFSRPALQLLSGVVSDIFADIRRAMPGTEAQPALSSTPPPAIPVRPASSLARTFSFSVVFCVGLLGSCAFTSIALQTAVGILRDSPESVTELPAGCPMSCREAWLFRFRGNSQHDFRGGDFQSAVLIQASLSRSDFSGANLRQATLRAADMTGAILRDADLSDVDATNTILAEADFSGAILARARLSGAFLHGADLSRANLEDVQLLGALYNSATKFPPGFDPASVGMIAD